MHVFYYVFFAFIFSLKNLSVFLHKVPRCPATDSSNKKRNSGPRWSQLSSITTFDQHVLLLHVLCNDKQKSLKLSIPTKRENWRIARFLILIVYSKLVCCSKLLVHKIQYRKHCENPWTFQMVQTCFAAKRWSYSTVLRFIQTKVLYLN